MAAALVAVAGCGTDEPPADKPATSPSPTPTESKDPHAAEKKAVLDVYRKMTEVEERIYATGKYDDKLEKYAAHKALSGIRATLFHYRQQGTVMKGEPKRSITVTAINTDADPMKAVLRECLDSSDYTKVDAETGKPVPYEGSTRHLVSSTAYRTEKADWKIVESAIDRERTC